MGKYRKILITLVATIFAFAMFAFTACGDGDDEQGDVTITLDKTTLTLKEGAAAVLTATVEGSDEAVVWSATPDDDSVITIKGIGETCTVTAVAEGTAKVKATVGEKFAECSVTVNGEGEQGEVSVTIDKKTLTLKAGASDTITATVEGSDEAVVWSATPNDESIITIAGSGKTCTVTAVAKGTAQVKATVGGKSAECSVTVNADDEQGGNEENLPKITAWEEVDNKVYASETIDGVDYIYHRIFLNDAVNQKYDFDSYEATVTLDGVAGEIVTAQAFNEADLNAHTYNMHIRIKGNQYQTTVFTINFKKDGKTVATGEYTREGDKEIVLDSGASMSISKGETETVAITSVNGKTDLADLTIAWTIEDTEGEGVATIPEDSDGTSVVVTAVAAGKATLTCTVGEGNDAFSKTCAITVVEGQVVIIAQDISSQYNFSNKFQSTGEAIQVYFNLQGEDYADLVEQIVPSKTTVTVTMDGEESTSSISRREWQDSNTYNLWIQVVVESDWTHDYSFRFSFKDAKDNEVAYATHDEIAPAALELSASKLNLKLVENQTVTDTLTATLKKVQGTVSWAIDKESVATIDVSDDGLSVTVTAVASGTATITVSVAGHDELTQTCAVTVLGANDQKEVTTITNILDPNDIFETEGVFAIHFYFMAGGYDFSDEISLQADRVEISVTKDGTEMSGARLGPNSSIGGDKSCHIHAVIPESRTDASGTYAITFKIKDSDGDVIAQGTFTKEVPPVTPVE